MYPTDHVFIFFRVFIFLQIFLINISIKPEVTQTNYLYTWRTIFALGHMLMASAQRWVDNQCCRCVLPCPDYKTPISGKCSDLTGWYVGICDGKCWILLTCFVYMAIYDLEIQLFHSFSYFQLWSVGYIALYKLNFQNWQHWKCLIPRGPFNVTANIVCPTVEDCPKGKWAFRWLLSQFPSEFHKFCKVIWHLSWKFREKIL